MEAVICYNFTIKNKIQVSDAQVVWAGKSDVHIDDSGKGNYSVKFMYIFMYITYTHADKPTPPTDVCFCFYLFSRNASTKKLVYLYTLLYSEYIDTRLTKAKKILLYRFYY